ncbi:MAG TPA: PD-(D/E)XK nuclease family protein [Desulfatiglandales bacterium]|nr:PD-(D/E)XK nuclease family protein [Desulfatiglandales bacterium]
MAQITYLIGQTIDKRRGLSDEEISRKGITLEQSLRIVPSHSAIRQLENQGPGWLHRPVDTLTSIVNRIFYDDILFRSFGDYAFMDDTMKELAIRVILHSRNRMPDGLQYFSSLFGPPLENESLPGIYCQILEFFSLLVGNNFEDRFVDRLSHKIGQWDDVRAGAGEQRYALDSDLALLFGDYEEFKRTNRVYDEDDILGSVRSFLSSGNAPSLLHGIKVILFDGFITITKAEEEILFCLFRDVEEVLWLLDFDPRADDPIAAFRKAAGHGEAHIVGDYEAYRISVSLVPLMDRVEKAGFPTAVKRAPSAGFRNPFSEGLYQSGKYDDSKENGLKIRSFHSRLDEIKGIAGEIKRIAYQEKTQDLSEIRVVFPDLGEYTSLIHEIFPEYGIPFNITRGLCLSTSPLSRIFQLLIDIPVNDYRTEDLHAFFTSGLVDPIPVDQNEREQVEWLTVLYEEGAFFAGEGKDGLGALLESRSADKVRDRLDIASVDKVARQCGIRGGEPLAEYVPRARDYFSFLYENSREGKGQKGILDDYYAFVRELFGLKKNIEPFRDLQVKKSPREAVQALFYLLDMFGVQKNVLSLLKEERGADLEARERIIRRDMRAFNTVKDLLVRTARDLEKAESYLPFSKDAPLLERFKRGFNTLLSRTRITEDYFKGVVAISEWADTMGCSFDYVFAGGLSADEFPLGEADDFIMPESSLGPLKKINLTDLSRNLFSHLLCNYRRDLYLSYAKSINDRDAQPSPVLLDMVSLVREDAAYHGTQTLEDSFPLGENPWFTNEQEFLNTIAVEEKTSLSPSQNSFAFDHLILGDNQFLNESVMRGVRSLIARTTIDGLSLYDGLVYQARRFPDYLSCFNETFSTSRLDMLANCPLRYLFGEIFSLEPLEEVAEELSFKDIGSHVHAILKMLFEELRTKGENVASIGLTKAFRLAREIGEGYFSRLSHLERLDFFEAQKAAIMDGLHTTATSGEDGAPKREGLLAQMIRFEEANLSEETITALEYRFGYGTERPVALGSTRIRGYVDRVDTIPGADTLLVIYDYKTGRAPALSDIKKGLSFQMPGYLFALTAEQEGSNAIARYYLVNRQQLSDNNTLTSPIAYPREQQSGMNLSGVKLIGDYADELMSLLKKGVFHHSADEMTCSFCDFKHACYKNTRRVGHLVDSGIFPDLYSGKRNMVRWKEVDDFRKRWKEIKKKMADLPAAAKEATKNKRLESIREFREWLTANRTSLPFYEGYLDGIIEEIESYLKSM